MPVYSTIGLPARPAPVEKTEAQIREEREAQRRYFRESMRSTAVTLSCLCILFIMLLLGAGGATVYGILVVFHPTTVDDDAPRIHLQRIAHGADANANVDGSVATTDLDEAPKATAVDTLLLKWKNLPRRERIIQIWESSDDRWDVNPRWVATDMIIYPHRTASHNESRNATDMGDVDDGNANGKATGNATFTLDHPVIYYMACAFDSPSKVGSRKFYTSVPCWHYERRDYTRDTTRPTLRFDEGGWGFLFFLAFLLITIFICCVCVGLNDYYHQYQDLRTSLKNIGPDVSV